MRLVVMARSAAAGASNTTKPNPRGTPPLLTMASAEDTFPNRRNLARSSEDVAAPMPPTNTLHGSARFAAAGAGAGCAAPVLALLWGTSSSSSSDEGSPPPFVACRICSLPGANGGSSRFASIAAQSSPEKNWWLRTATDPRSPLPRRCSILGCSSIWTMEHAPPEHWRGRSIRCGCSIFRPRSWFASVCGGSPDSISWSSTPRPHQSTPFPHRSPRRSSGARYRAATTAG